MLGILVIRVPQDPLVQLVHRVKEAHLVQLDQADLEAPVDQLVQRAHWVTLGTKAQLEKPDQVVPLAHQAHRARQVISVQLVHLGQLDPLAKEEKLDPRELQV